MGLYSAYSAFKQFWHTSDDANDKNYMTSEKPLKFPKICMQPRLSSTNSSETSNAQRQKTQTVTNKFSGGWFLAEIEQMSLNHSNF